MRLLKQSNLESRHIEQLYLDTDQLDALSLKKSIRSFEPEVIFALSDHENAIVLKAALDHFCNFALFHPTAQQISAINLEKAHGLARVFFLKKNHRDLAFFQHFGPVIHQNYLAECEKLLYAVSFFDEAEMQNLEH